MNISVKSVVKLPETDPFCWAKFIIISGFWFNGTFSLSVIVKSRYLAFILVFVIFYGQLAVSGGNWSNRNTCLSENVFPETTTGIMTGRHLINTPPWHGPTGNYDEPKIYLNPARVWRLQAEDLLPPLLTPLSVTNVNQLMQTTGTKINCTTRQTVNATNSNSSMSINRSNLPHAGSMCSDDNDGVKQWPPGCYSVRKHLLSGCIVSQVTAIST